MFSGWWWKFLRNNGQYLPDCTAQHTRRQPFLTAKKFNFITFTSPTIIQLRAEKEVFNKIFLLLQNCLETERFLYTRSFKENNQAMKINIQIRQSTKSGEFLPETCLMVPIFSLYKQGRMYVYTVMENLYNSCFQIPCLYEIPPHVMRTSRSFKHFSLLFSTTSHFYLCFSTFSVGMSLDSHK